ncbi:phosphopantetheine-binding protein, partial [Maribacter sp. 2307UL18-2]|uniref:phosphopantetheine-binding protein n=1 Tax=Maribacter sp. 2307UL18-2 TaxID=3386274 RepID=UPI0039BD3F82
EYMLPKYYVQMDSFPLTPNGKIDRRALPDPELTTSDDYVGPTNEIEKQLIDVWSDVLKIDAKAISINANFFKLGGDSIKAAKLISKINRHFNIHLKLSHFYEKGEFRSLAEHILIIKQVEISKKNLTKLVKIKL